MTIASERVVNGIKTRVLHGKDYVEVAERVRIAHSSEHQFEQVETTHFAIAERWFVRCSITVDGKLYIGTAEIKFTAPKNTPDGTNPFECAETSALGRALAFAGLGTVESIASFDEVYRVEAIEDATMHGRPVIEAAPAQRQLPPAQGLRNGDGTPALTREEGAQPADAETMDKIRAFCKALGREVPQGVLDQATADKLLRTLQVDYRDAKAKKTA